MFHEWTHMLREVCSITQCLPTHRPSEASAHRLLKLTKCPPWLIAFSFKSRMWPPLHLYFTTDGYILVSSFPVNILNSSVSQDQHPQNYPVKIGYHEILNMNGWWKWLNQSGFKYSNLEWKPPSPGNCFRYSTSNKQPNTHQNVRYGISPIPMLCPKLILILLFSVCAARSFKHHHWYE